MTRRQFLALFGFAVGFTCVAQVVCYPVTDRGTDPLLLILAGPVTVAALCVRHIRPEEPLNRPARVALKGSIAAVYLLTLWALYPVALLRDSWLFDGYVVPKWGYDQAFATVVALTAAAGVFGCVCLTCLMDKYAVRVVERPAAGAKSGSGVYAGACRSGPEPRPAGSFSLRARHPCD